MYLSKFEAERHRLNCEDEEGNVESINNQQESSCAKASSSGDGRVPAICFNKNVKVYKTLHKNNYSEEEFISTWYNDHDYNKIRDEINVTLEMMRNGGIPDSDSNKWYCSRGLEARISTGAKCKLRNRRKARKAVLFEQTFREMRTYSNPDWLALVYSVHSHPCHTAAHRTAIHDEKEALR